MGEGGHRVLKRIFSTSLAAAAIVAAIALSFPAAAFAEDSCESVVKKLNRTLQPKIDEQELVEVLRTLNDSDNRRLPSRFVTKRQAKQAGWRPGQDLWSQLQLRGKSIGGDIFKNFEGKLTAGSWTWHEADLAYHGGHRGSKRLIYSNDGLWEVTVDHYRTFHEVPSCR